MSLFRDDLRWAVRHATRRPVFAVTVIGTLAIAIATATTAFGAASAVLWRALPFDDAEQLAFVWEEIEREGRPEPARVTSARYAAWRDAGSGASLAAFGAAGFTVDLAGQRTTVRGVRVTTNYFDVLGIRPVLGRPFLDEEQQPGQHRVVVLSHPFWMNTFGGRSGAIGETLRLSGEPYTIVGVMPPVTFPAWPVNPADVTLEADQRQFWVPIPRTPQFDQSGRAHVLGVIARIPTHTTADELVARLNRTSNPAAVDPHRATLVPVRDQFVAGARTPLIILALAALAVLAIACANLAALYLSAFESRRAEMAVRAAIGAGLPRLVRQLALETLLLTAGGAVAGVAIAHQALLRVPAMLPPSFPFLTAPAMDGRVWVFVSALTAAAALAIAGWPIVRLLKSPSPRGTAAGPRGDVYRVLVVSQIAAAFALVVAAALLGQSLLSVQRRDPGFAIDRVLVAQLGLPARTPPDPARIVADEQRLLDAIRSRPDIEAVATAYDDPLSANWSESPAISGAPGAPDERRATELRIVSPGYFDAMAVALLDGRTFTEHDAFDTRGVAMVNEALAAELGGQVLGRVITTGTPRGFFGDRVPGAFEIIGIVANERFNGLEQPTEPAFYLSTRQFPQTGVALLVRTTGDPIAAAADVRGTIREVDASVTVTGVTSLEAMLGEQLAPRRLTADLIGGFGAAALTLAALGLYGLLAVLVGARMRDIGVRLALGASPTSVARQIVREGLVCVGTGVVLGALLALATGRVLESLLVGVSATDPITFAVVAGVLLTVSITAALLPARRAARIDPVVVLRSE